jgi:hypothetical protein
MKFAVLIPDGGGVRNFLLGQFVNHLAPHPVTIFHQIPEHLLPHYPTDRPVEWRRILPLSDTRLTLLLRNALSFAHMHWADTASMRYLLTLKFGGSWRTRSAMRAARFAGRLSASQRRIRRLDRLHAGLVQRSAEVSHYVRIFEEVRPSLLFCTTHRALAGVPAVLAARKLGIPTVAFIFSWDNLSSKGRIVAPFDYFLVWSELMRHELAQYYPDVPLDRIFVVGSPQFDPYRDRSLLWTRDEFFSRIGADPSRPLICYSGGDRTIYPAEDQFVRVLLELVRSGRITRRPQVLLRPAPVDDGARYDAVRAAFPELIYAPAGWFHIDPENWTRVVPQPSDVQFLANLTQHADLNVNLASTMTLDFAIHDKPVVNVAFDPVMPPPLGRPLWDLYYKFEHYRPVVELGAARFARSEDELADHINAYFEDPTLDRDSRRRFVQLENDGPVGHAAARIADALTVIARQRALRMPAVPLDSKDSALTAGATWH